MTAEHLREVITEGYRQQHEEEPNAFDIANQFAAMQWWVFEAETKKQQKPALETFRYDDIDKLRADAAELILSFRNELEAKDWETLFKRRREFPPYLNVPNENGNVA